MQRPETQRKLRVCHLSKAGRSGGGASRIAEELVSLLSSQGHHTSHGVRFLEGTDHKQTKKIYGVVTRKAHSLQKRLGFPELVPFEMVELVTSGLYADYDLFHFHDLSSAISPMTLYFLSQFKPVVWTFHDCSPFTGGCLYPMDCNKFQSQCGCRTKETIEALKSGWKNKSE